jgi:hypothetical protein
MLKEWNLRNNGEGCKPYPVAEDMGKRRVLVNKVTSLRIL